MRTWAPHFRELVELRFGTECGLLELESIVIDEMAMESLSYEECILHILYF